MIAGYAIRPVSVDDAPIIADHRRAMFFDMGHHDPAVLDAMSGHFIPWLIPRLQTGEYLGWFATSRESVAAGVGIWLMDWPPHLIGPGIRRANIINVYTASEHRRRGLARALMLTALDWCRDSGIRSVILHASSDGRTLYQSLGFTPTNEMRLNLTG